MLKFVKQDVWEPEVLEEYEVFNDSGNSLGRVFLVKGGHWLFQQDLPSSLKEFIPSMLVEDLDGIVEFTKYPTLREDALKGVE